MDTLYADLRQALEPLLGTQQRQRLTSQPLLDTLSHAPERDTTKNIVPQDLVA